MTTQQTPPAPAANTNRVGLSKNDYKGLKSTLCAGCGHDSITNHIISACYDLGVEPHRIAKLSGIGCSSKTPAYFMNQAHGFNAVHGRMPSVATGAAIANRLLKPLGVSGDGDSASIGMGQLVHIIRRNVELVYIVENNGVYGLTKGQFSATADVGSKAKGGAPNVFDPIDICSLAIDLGCAFVARSFSGDGKQLVPLLKAALAHKGTAILDVISPCVTFNDHEGSTKSYAAVKQKDQRLHEVGFIPTFQNIEVDYAEGTTRAVELHDGSVVTLRKLEREYDPTDPYKAMETLQRSRAAGELLTGLIYVNPKKEDFVTTLNLVDHPLATLPQEATRPGPEALEEIMEALR
jgi:2-oxoglutarate/2-oxoacid ferredoxin oxidoreductase subunit beta